MENTAMRLASDGSTNPTLLKKVADWGDHLAWVRFRDTYNPLLERWCRGYGLDEDTVDEVCHRIWIELADRMKTFEYDPDRTFRGWLRRLCESRVLNFLRQRRTASLLSLNEWREGLESIASRRLTDPDVTDEGGDLPHLFLLAEAEKVQATVRAKVKPHTWDAFWLIAVCDWSVERTAQSLEMTHTAVYAARERVARMLGDEGNRVSGAWTSEH
jgi:DNA-directed RNA polymerase specialized sigma24 family protein